MKAPTDPSDLQATADDEITSVAAAIVDAFAETVRLAAPQTSHAEFDALLGYFCEALRRRFEGI